MKALPLYAETRSMKSWARAVGQASTWRRRRHGRQCQTSGRCRASTAGHLAGTRRRTGQTAAAAPPWSRLCPCHWRHGSCSWSAGEGGGKDEAAPRKKAAMTWGDEDPAATRQVSTAGAQRRWRGFVGPATDGVERRVDSTSTRCGGHRFGGGGASGWAQLCLESTGLVASRFGFAVAARVLYICNIFVAPLPHFKSAQNKFCKKIAIGQLLEGVFWPQVS